MISAKRFLLIVFAVLVIANSYLAHSYRNNEKAIQVHKQEEKNRKLLEKCHALFNINNIFTPKLFKLFSQIEGKNVTEMESIYKAWCKNIGMPSEAFRIVVYNVPDISKNPPDIHNALNVKPEEQDDWNYAMHILDAGDYKNIKRVVGDEQRRLVKILISGIGFSQILRRPEQIAHIGTSNQNTYAIWFKAKKKVEKGKINAAIVLLHKSYLDSRTDSLAKLFFSEYNLNNEKYGYFNSLDPTKSYLPNGISSFRINDELKEKDIKSGFKSLDSLGISAYSKPNGDIFIAVNQQPFVPYPLWTTALFFFWFPIWLYHYKQATGDYKLSLKALSLLMLLLVVIQPSILITNYWDKLLESKRKSLIEAKTKEMFNNLVQIDTNESEINRLLKKRYKKMTKILEKTEKNPEGLDNKEAMQKFIDETMKLELKGYYDTCLIYDKKGNNLRDFSTSSSIAKLLALYPKSFIDEQIHQYSLQGWTPFDGELKFIDDNYQEKFNINNFLSMKPPQGTMALIPIVKAITSELVDTYNTRHKLSESISVKSQLTSGMLSSMMGGKGDEYIYSIYNNLGSFFEFGYGSEISLNYIDLLLDAKGKAKYGLFLFSGIYNYTRTYFDKIFKEKKNWPKNTNFLAMTKYKLTINFPYVDLWQRLGKMFEIMQPPTNQYSEEIKINGIPSILCAYRGNKIENYILMSHMPISAIENEVNAFKIKMYIATVLCLSMIGFIIYRINTNVIEPTKTLMTGVTAMKSGQYGYRISLKTGDEWERLAYAYNQSLRSMKDLEIATFIQDTFLPSGRIKSGLIQFTGKTISADGIGGDYFDAFTPQENHMMFLFGDVSGHSVGAALVVSMAHAGFASLFDSGIREPSEILRSFSNLMLTNLKRVKMMTCFSGYIDSDGNMACSNAGQTFPLIVDENGNVTKVSVIGYPLGSAKRAKFKQDTVKLPDRCRIVLYSDGMIEAMNEAGEPFGYERFEELVKEMACSNTMEEFRDRLYKELHAFSDPVPWNDDCSVAIVDYTKPELDKTAA